MATPTTRILDDDPTTWEITTAGAGPQGRLPLTAEMLLDAPSGDVFGLTQNAGITVETDTSGGKDS